MLNKLKTIGLYLLRIAALFYQIIIAGRNFAYDLLPGLSKAVDLPIICVGNITTGGTGKTPMAAFLAGYFQSIGLRVAILSRGYGRQDKNSQQVITDNSKKEVLSAEKIGDEALMLHQQLSDVTLVLDADRVRGAKTIYREDQADIILMDDGFQHRRLRRNFNLIMIDSQRLFANRQLLPAGPLREPLSSLKRADVVIFNKFDQRHPRFYSQTAEILNHVAPHKLFCASYRYNKFTSLTGCATKNLTEMQALGPFCAVSGLANNDYFFTQLKASGLKLENSRSFKDHHIYTDRDFTDLKTICRGRALLTTAKDADKLKTLISEKDKSFLQQIWVAEIELKIEDEARFLKLLTKFLP